MSKCSKGFTQIEYFLKSVEKIQKLSLFLILRKIFILSSIGGIYRDEYFDKIEISKIFEIQLYA